MSERDLPKLTKQSERFFIVSNRVISDTRDASGEIERETSGVRVI